MTVFAWCLIASTGRVSSSIACGQRGGEVLDHHARRADLAVLDLVRVERDDAGRVAEQRREPHRGAAPRGCRRSRRRAGRRRTGARSGSSRAAGGRARRRASAAPSRRRRASIAARASRSGRAGRVDRQRRLVAEEVPDHRREHERERRVHRGHLDRLERGAEPVVALVDDHDRRRLVGPVDRDLLGDVVGVRAATARPRTPGSAAPTTGRCASCPR